MNPYTMTNTRPHTIGIEGAILTRSIAGIGFYTYNLTKALAQLDSDERYMLFYNRPLPSYKFPSRLRHCFAGPRSTHLWAQTRLPLLCNHHNIDLLHSPGQGIPLCFRGKKILTIHDLSPLLYPGQKELTSRLIWNLWVPQMARACDHIITVSNHTRRDVITLLGIEEKRITTVHEAAGEEYYPEPDTDALQRFLHQKALGDGYILAVGTLEPRKNYPFLFRAFARWLERESVNATLVIVGQKGWLYDDIFRSVHQLGLEKHVRFEGYVRDNDVMRKLYSGARFTCMAPVYEGFWLPGLESLACGTAVLASHTSSIPEIVGNAGTLIHGYDEDEWASAMHQQWTRPQSEQDRQQRLNHARSFSWKRAAVETRNVYRNVLEQS